MTILEKQKKTKSDRRLNETIDCDGFWTCPLCGKKAVSGGIYSHQAMHLRFMKQYGYSDNFYTAVRQYQKEDVHLITFNQYSVWQ